MNTEYVQSPLVGRGEPIPQVPWGWKAMLAAIVFAAVGILVLNVAIIGIGLLLRIPLRNDKDIVAVFLALQDLIIVGGAWLFGVRRYHVGWEQVGIRQFPVPLGCGLSLGLLILSYLVRLVYGIIAMALGMQIPQQDVLTRLDMTGWGFLGTLIAAGVIAPVAEEIFFRGFLYGGLRRRIGVVGGMIISTLFFTVLHFTLPLFIPIFVLGLFLAMLYEYTGSLYPGIFLHSANNTLALILLFILQNTGLVPVK